MKDTSQIMKEKSMDLSVSYVNKILGIKLSVDEIQNLLIKAGMKSNIINKNRIRVFIPPYRTDILQRIDIVEDIAIAYGYENFIPEIPKIFTIGEEDKFQKFCNKIRAIMIGLNFQEIMSLILTNKQNLFNRMNIEETEVVETENALSTEHNVVRNYLLPSLMSFLEKNKTKGYPQKIFEIGICVEKNGENFQEVTKICGVIANTKTNFSEIKAIVEGLLLSVDENIPKIAEDNSKFFINGRAGKILIKDKNIGHFGEISPIVIQNFGIEVPVTAFEINLKALFSL